MKNELVSYIVREVLGVGGLDVIGWSIAVSLAINVVVVSGCLVSIWFVVQCLKNKRVF